MLRTLLAFVRLAGLLALFATPALASGIMSAGVLLSCASYTFIAQAWNLTPGSQYSISYNFVLTSTIVAPPVSSANTITFTTVSTTSTQTSIQGIAPSLTANYTGFGSATLVNLTTSTTPEIVLITFSPSPVSCAPLTL
jgi:hypothetical protein